MRKLLLCVSMLTLAALACGMTAPEAPAAKVSASLPRIHEAELTTYEVTADTLNIRAYPDGLVIGYLTKGDTVNVFATELVDGTVWVNIGSGWVAERYLKEKGE